MEYIEAKAILTFSENDPFKADYIGNLYRGCNFGCIYCENRADCYALKRFDTVRVKRNALEILENELLNRRKRSGVIRLGTLSDSYNSEEKEQELTRGALRLIDKYGFGVIIETKSDLIVRDVDILKSISRHSPVIVQISVSSPYDDSAKKFEPKAPSPKRRFSALKALTAEGIFAGVTLTPVLPFIEDNSASLLSLLLKTEESGGKFAYFGEYFGVRMRDSQRAHFLKKAEKLFPGLEQEYINKYGERLDCVSENNGELYKAFVAECDKRKLLYKAEDIRAKADSPFVSMQLSLFDF